MAKKVSKTKSLPAWLKSKWFLFGAAVAIALIVIFGLNSFAASLPTYPTSLATCKTKVLYKGGPNNTKDCVKYAQDRLNYYCMTVWPITTDLVVDGVFGDKTKAKTMGFQKSTGLTPDGVIGPNTWSKLSQMYAEGKANKGYCVYSP